VKQIATGLRVKELRRGDGPLAEAGRIVLVHYDCFLPRGEKCASSRERSYPVQFEVGQRRVYPALEQGVVGMAVGGLRSIRVSPQLTYYERTQLPDLPPDVALRYEIELLRVSGEWDNSIYPPVMFAPPST
jgi:FKBP-type peptidyl-prolyl cis-trans isomerase